MQLKPKVIFFYVPSIFSPSVRVLMVESK